MSNRRMCGLKCGQNTRGESVACKCRTVLRVENCAAAHQHVDVKAASCLGEARAGCFFEWSGGLARERLSILLPLSPPSPSHFDKLLITFPHISKPRTHRYRREIAATNSVMFPVIMRCIGSLDFTSFTPSHTSVRTFSVPTQGALRNKEKSVEKGGPDFPGASKGKGSLI